MPFEKLFFPLFIFSFLVSFIEYKSQAMSFYYVLRERNVNEISKHLESGINPDYLTGDFYWGDRNPLWFILRRGGIDNLDLEIIHLLINYGADVNLRPYIWHILDQRILTDENIEWMQAAEGRVMLGTTVELMLEKLYILIEAGADVNSRGAPNRLLFPATDSNYQHYFSQEGTRPINHAIKNNLPDIVDLLLQYTFLDEESLKAALESNSSNMIEKINLLWNLQEN